MQPTPNATPVAPVSAVEAEVLRVRELLERKRFADALGAAQALSATVPQNRDVLYMLAVAQRYLQKVADALATLARLEEFHPTYSRLYQERGHCYVNLRDAPNAIDAFIKGVNLNPALPASWQMLVTLYRMTGQPENSALAASHVAALEKLPPSIVTATSMFSDGELVPAERLCRDYLLKHGDHIEAMRLLARIGLKHEALDDAEILLEAVVKMAPDYRPARYDYATALLRRHKHVQAVAELQALMDEEPQNRAFRTTYATAIVGLGQHERALEIYRELLADAPRAADLHLSVAHSLKTMGRQAEAVDSYRAAADARPSYGDAYWSLANLKTYRFTEAEIAQMRLQEAAAATDLVDRYHLCFALGKALEDREEFADSFTYYDRGNELKRAETHYRPEPIERNTRLQIQVCTTTLFESRRGTGDPRPDPIFIVGLPRAGSTLLEQILASHSQVEGTQELANIPRFVQELQGREPDPIDPNYPRVLTELTPQALAELGAKYIDDTRIYRHDRPFFIDKMPNNFRHIGLIHLILPNAKIIDARRNPLACCFSNFKQLFAGGQEFTYGLEEIGRYYKTYVELMAHWDSVLPGKVLHVQHESVVDDLEENVRRILDFCELPFERNCLEFYKTERSVRTASSEQVRRPIYKEGLNQWRHFEPWLQPLKDVLGPLAEQ